MFNESSHEEFDIVCSLSGPPEQLGLVTRGEARVLKRRECSRVHCDYDDQTFEVKLFVT